MHIYIYIYTYMYTHTPFGRWFPTSSSKSGLHMSNFGGHLAGSAVPFVPFLTEDILGKRSNFGGCLGISQLRSFAWRSSQRSIPWDFQEDSLAPCSGWTHHQRSRSAGCLAESRAPSSGWSGTQMSSFATQKVNSPAPSFCWICIPGWGVWGCQGNQLPPNLGWNRTPSWGLEDFLAAHAPGAGWSNLRRSRSLDLLAKSPAIFMGSFMSQNGVLKWPPP